MLAVTHNWYYEYDAANQLRTVRTLADGETVQKTTLEATYDFQGQRFNKTHYPNGKEADPTNKITTWYLSPSYEMRETPRGRETTKHIFANGQKIASITHHEVGDPPEAGLPGSTTEGLPEGIVFYHTDHLGSSSVITDEQGQEVSRYTYEPFGKLVPSRSTGQNRVTHKFTGQELDEESDLYYYNARYYDPSLGRFLTADTLVPNWRNPQAYNRYAYVYNNPIQYTDPTGHLPNFNHNTGEMTSDPDDNIPDDSSDDPKNNSNNGNNGGNGGKKDESGKINGSGLQASDEQQDIKTIQDAELLDQETANHDCSCGPKITKPIEDLLDWFDTPPPVPRWKPDKYTNPDERLAENNANALETDKGTKPTKIDENTDPTDTSTWPDPPVDGPLQEGDPSRSKPKKRGEKSLYDQNGGEWRPHKPDKYHPEGHWDYKPNPKGPWKDIYIP